MYGDRKPPEDPPCVTCHVEPFPENEEALRVFMGVRYQFIMGFSGPVDLNHLAIEAAMRREGIPVTDKACFDRVCRLGWWWIERLQEKKDEG